MDFGLALQNHRPGASPAGLTASADAVTRHGWRSVWAVDHLVVASNEATDYGRTLECLTSLAWLGASHPGLRLATGVLVPPMRDAVQLAKELATLDVLTDGRLVVGVGVGDEDDAGEYRNLGKEDRFHHRGAYLDTFTELRDFAFEPLPSRGAGMLVLSGGRSDRALSRVGRITDGFYSSRWGPDDLGARWPAMVEAAAANGRPRPYLATRVRVRFDAPPDGRYSVCGSPSEIVTELGRFAALGTDEFVAVFDAVLPADIERAADRFALEVIAPFQATHGASEDASATDAAQPTIPPAPDPDARG
jgi:alkanesulfonate monooxygenase SsuD/methylene tetrahydromethanopterin reductase-like flavin-dependent oxidoreductase (luciferase family)